MTLKFLIITVLTTIVIAPVFSMIGYFIRIVAWPAVMIGIFKKFLGQNIKVMVAPITALNFVFDVADDDYNRENLRSALKVRINW